ncbi:MAG TPA: site-2 protease family protein [Polyangiaceae bacterium]|jgi:membrane-associated protease RseP (regulator of RpoE activity)
MPSADGSAAAVAGPLAWRTNAGLFLATVGSCLVTWSYFEGFFDKPSRPAAIHALEYTASLLGILLAHEFGHYIAARIHKVDASLPFFIPLPILSPFGTMGAVIRMRSVIPTRRALLDIGASGPLAGLAVALPLYAWGVAHSKLVPLDGSAGGGIELGSSLLLRLIDHLFAPPIPQGMDIFLSPVAYAGWAGMFVTMINLLPVSQLDAGHIAFSLFGPRQNTIAQWVHRSMLAFFFVSLGSFVARDVRAGFGLYHLGRHISNSQFWLLWFEVLAVLGNVSSREGPDRIGIRPRVFATLGLALLAGVFHDRTSPLLWVTWFAGLGVLLAMEVRWGALRSDSTLLDHPPTGAQPLTAGRAAIAVFTLVLFLLLFMPTPFSI